MSDQHPVKVLFKDREDFRQFLGGQDMSFVAIALLYTTICTSLALVWFAATLSWAAAIPLWIVGFFVIGWAQYSIGNGMHEAVHHNLRNKNADFWASLLTAYPIGLTMRYRETHLKHHRHIGTEADPEFGLYNRFPASKLELLFRFVWFFSGVPAITQFLSQQANAPKGNRSARIYEAVTFVAVQGAIFLLFLLVFSNVFYYFAFWAIPIATVGKLLSTTRLLCEHGSPDHVWIVRSIDGPWWQTWTMGAFDFNYHAEHHLSPGIPYANLEKLHRRNRKIAEQNPSYQPFDGRMEFYSGGYLRLLAEWFRSLPWISRHDKVPVPR